MLIIIIILMGKKQNILKAKSKRTRRLPRSIHGDLLEVWGNQLEAKRFGILHVLLSYG